MNEFKAAECIKFGWETFKKRPWFLIGVTFLYLGITLVISNILAPFAVTFGDPRAGTPADFSLPRILVSLVQYVIGTFLMMSVTALILKAHDGVETVTLSDAWKPKLFLPYLLVTIATSIIIGIGFILLIVPGIIAMTMLFFASYIVIDKGMGAMDAIDESRTITKGNRMEIFFLFLMSLGVLILGTLALLVGLLVAAPVVYLATVHAYRTLSAQKESIVPAAPLASAAPVVS